MKTFFKTLMIAALFAASANSAVAQENTEDVEIWAKENFEYYSQAPRSEFVKLRLDKQHAIYKLFTPERKAEIWKYKWDDVRKSEHLSKEEKRELKKIYRTISPKIYEYGDSKEDRKFKKIAVEVEKTMTEKYGWSEDKLFFYGMVAMTEAEFEEYCNIYKENEFGLDFLKYVYFEDNGLPAEISYILMSVFSEANANRTITIRREFDKKTGEYITTCRYESQNKTAE